MYVFAGLRLLTGFVFLWTFLDKTFGLGYATRSGTGWIDGGSSTKGFLGGVAAGPMESAFHDWAGAARADWLFMLGLLAIGLALTRGRAAARRRGGHGDDGADADRTVAARPAPVRRVAEQVPGPDREYHVIYAVVLIALAAAGAGATWGLGKAWARLPIVSRNRWLL